MKEEIEEGIGIEKKIETGFDDLFDYSPLFAKSMKLNDGARTTPMIEPEKPGTPPAVEEQVFKLVIDSI